MGGGLIGALRVTLGIDAAAFEEGSKRARKTAVADATAITKAYGGMRSAIAGFMAGISVGALVTITGKALDYASALGEVAQQLGVTTRDLQEYRYAATQVGISQDEMEKGLAKLTLTMGKARAGAKAPVEAFKALSDLLGKDILQNAATAGDAIPLISDALAKVADPARRAEYEVALFGKTGQKLDTLLAGGSVAVNELRDAAQSLGLVLSDEQIQNADKTADKLAELNQVLDANIAGAVSDNADAVYNLADSFMKLAVAAVQAGDAMKNSRLLSTIDAERSFGAKLGVDFGELLSAAYKGQDFKQLSDQNEAVLMKTGSGRQALLTQTAERYNASTDATERAALRAREKRIRQAQAQAGKSGKVARPATTGDGSGDTGGGAKSKTPRTSGSGQARGRQIDPAKQTERYNDEMARLEDEQLRLQGELTAETGGRLDYAQRRIGLDMEAYKQELDAKVRTGELTAAQAHKLELGKKFNIQLERDVADQRSQDDTTREALSVEAARLDLQGDLKRGELSEAKSQSERRRLQGELLDIEYDRQRAALNAVLALNSSTQAEKDIAKARLAQLDLLKAHDREGVRRDTAGPIEQFRDGLHRTAEQVQEDFERIQVDGIENLNDGLVDAIVNSKSLGDVFSRVADQIVADLIRIALREAESAIFGGKSGGGDSGGGIGGFLKGIGSFFSSVSGGGGSTGARTTTNLPKFARGGSFTVPGSAGIDTNLMSINGMPVARIDHGERIRVEPRGRRERDPVIVQLAVEEGALFRPVVRSEAGDVSVRTVGGANRAIQRQNRQRLG